MYTHTPSPLIEQMVFLETKNKEVEQREGNKEGEQREGNKEGEQREGNKEGEIIQRFPSPSGTHAKLLYAPKR
jgi:hypothetical protein